MVFSLQDYKFRYPYTNTFTAKWKTMTDLVKMQIQTNTNAGIREAKTNFGTLTIEPHCLISIQISIPKEEYKPRRFHLRTQHAAHGLMSADVTFR